MDFIFVGAGNLWNYIKPFSAEENGFFVKQEPISEIKI